MTDTNGGNFSDELEGYGIVERVGGGGQRDVYRGESPAGEEVAIKLMPIDRDHLPDELNLELRKRAQKEVKAMEKVGEGFAQLLDHFEVDLGGSRHFVTVEEYIDGNTLKDYLAEHGPDLELGYNVATSILSTICEFDKHGAVHRDIKPSNIMLTESDIVLIDAGVVRFIYDTSLTPTARQEGLGTYSYAPPEQTSSKKGLITTRCDIFSTGVVFFESLTGVHPFCFDGITRRKAIEENRKRSLSGYLDNKELESDFSEIYDKMTAHRPYKRFRKPEFARQKIMDVGDEYGIV